MNTDHATNFLFAVEQLQFRFSCGVNALGAIHTAMEEGSSSPECYLDGLFGIYRHLCDLSDELEKIFMPSFSRYAMKRRKNERID